MGRVNERTKALGIAACLTMVLAAAALAGSTVVQEAEPNDVVPQALGALAASTTLGVEARSGYNGDIDWYSFSIAADAPQAARLAVESIVSWQIVLYSGDMHPVGSGTDSLTRNLGPGEYRVRVQPSDLGREAYVFLVSTALEAETNDGLAEATALGVVQTEPLTIFASIDPAGDVDFFSFDVPQSFSDTLPNGSVRVLRIDASCPSGDTLVVLYAPSGDDGRPVPVSRSDDWGEGSWSRLYVADPAPGRYTVRVHEYADNELIEAYRVVVTPMTVSDSEPNDPGTGTPLGELPPQGRLAVTEFLGADDIDAFRFTVASPVCVRIETSGASGGDSVIALYNVANEEDAVEDDEGGDGSWSRLFQRLEPGRYEVLVLAADERDQFDYTLAIEAVACPAQATEEEPNNGAASANAILLPTEVSGTLVAGDPDCFRFVLTSTSMVIAETNGEGETDTILCLLDSAGETIACDDDGGTGLWSRIERELAPGAYVVKVELYGGAAEAPYRLLVRSEELSP